MFNEPYAEKMMISNIKFRYEGLFDYDGLYLMMQRWLSKKGYNFYETKYKHKPMELGEESEIEWVAEKKVTGYYMHFIKIEFHLWDINDVEIKGKTWSQARMEINFTGTLILDYEGNWGKNAVLKFLRDFYHEYVIKEPIDHIWGEDMRLEILALAEDTKKFLSSYTTGKSF